MGVVFVNGYNIVDCRDSFGWKKIEYLYCKTEQITIMYNMFIYNN